MDSQIIDRLTDLRDEPAGPISADLQLAIRTGRKRVRIRRAAVGGIALVVVAAVLGSVSIVARFAGHAPIAPATTPSPSVPPLTITQCAVAPLALPASTTYADTRAVDSTGHYAAGEYFARGSDYSRAVLWHDGVATVVDLPGVRDQLTAINSSGVALGNSQPTPGGVEQHWVYASGAATRLTGIKNAQPNAINDSGLIVGLGADPHGIVAMKWEFPATTGTKLPVPDPAWQAWATVVGNDGTIAGLAGPSYLPADNRIIVWRPDGTYQMLVMPDIKSVDSIRPIAVEGDRLMALVNLKSTSLLKTVAVIYDLRTGTPTVETMPLEQIDGSDRTGRVWFGPQSSGKTRSEVVWTATGGMVNLPTVSETSPDVSALALDGRVLVGDSDGQPLIWRCG